MSFTDIDPFGMQINDAVLKKIKIIRSNDKLTASAGLGTLVEIFDQSGLKKDFIKCLPKRVSHRSQGSYRLALNMLCGFIHGFDCLDDYERLDEDKALIAAFGFDSPSSRTFGDFIKDFSKKNISDLNKFLSRMSWSMMASLKDKLPEEYKPQNVCLDIDSTEHVQSSNKMEGLGWNYKKNYCLDSQVVFNQKGFCHGFDLREGNRRSGFGGDWLLEQSLTNGRRQFVNKFQKNTFVRGDSAYCQQKIIKSIMSKGALFTVTANDGTTGWKKQLKDTGVSWQPWEYTEKELEKAKLKDKKLPLIELGYFYWSPKWSQKNGAKLVFPIVVKRTLKKRDFEETRNGQTQLSLIREEDYIKSDPFDYYAVVSNFPLDLAKEKSNLIENFKRYSLQEVMTFHHKRSNSENFIREEKYNYDLKHFPCLKLNANRAYGQLAMVAHNLLRWVSIMMRPDKPHFSKKLRNRFVFFAGRVVKHSGQLFLKVGHKGYEEVMKLREVWGFKPEKIPLQYSSA